MSETSPRELPKPLFEGSLRLSRRGLVLGTGLALSSGLFLPDSAQAQIVVKPIALRFADRKRCVDAFAGCHHWQSTHALCESIKEGELADADAAALKAANGFLIGSLKRRSEDADFLAKVVGEHREAFRTILIASIEQSPVRDKEKQMLLETASKTQLDELLTNKGESVLPGVETALEKAQQETGVARINDEKLRESWICLLSRAMLTAALGSSQWEFVAPLALRLQTNSCLPAVR